VNIVTLRGWCRTLLTPRILASGSWTVSETAQLASVVDPTLPVLGDVRTSIAALCRMKGHGYVKKRFVNSSPEPQHTLTVAGTTGTGYWPFAEEEVMKVQ
jgi:hypothetical protein